MGRVTDQAALQKAWERRIEKMPGINLLDARDQENLAAAFKDGFQAARDYYQPKTSHIVELRVITVGSDVIEPSDIEDALMSNDFYGVEVIDITKEHK